METETTIQDVSYGYPQSPQLVLDKFKLSFPAGKFVSIVGPNGCGKSTLLRIIAGLCRPTDPSEHTRIEQSICGKHTFIAIPATWDDMLHRHTTLVFQKYLNIVFGWQKVKDAIAWARPTRDDYFCEIYSWFPTLGKLQDKYWCNLSGGEQQMVALARGILRDPDVLLLDEPLASIDPWYRYQIEDCLLRLNDYGKKNRTTILVTHDLDAAVYLSDIIYHVTGPPLKVSDGVIQVSAPRSKRNFEFRRSEEFLNVRDTLYKRVHLNSDCPAPVSQEGAKS